MWPRASGTSSRASEFSHQGHWLPPFTRFSGVLRKLGESVEIQVHGCLGDHSSCRGQKQLEGMLGEGDGVQEKRNTAYP